MMSKIKYITLIFFLSLFLCPLKVFASGSATIGFSGNNSVIVGNEITITMYVGNVNSNNGGVVSLGGNLSFDSNYLEYLSGSGVSSPYQTQMNKNNNYKFAGLDTTLSNGITKNTTIFTFKFKAKKTGSTSIRVTNGMLSDKGAKLAVSTPSKTIQIVEPPSTNNNLSSLSVSAGSLNFNKNTTNYKVNVSENTSSINISASAEDSKARVSGTGNKNLNLGDNNFSIVVTAPSGDKKTYTVVVNRKDNRSSNNNLSSLSISSGKINFNKNTTTYNVNVPFDVTSVKVTAKAEDSKAKVNISDGNNLVAEETRNVVVKVTAENGSVKTYTIKVTRGKDPNKKLSTNNNLASLVPSVGELNPKFDKDSLNYEVKVDFEVKKIEFKTTTEETKYAKVKMEGPESLSVGKNKFTFTVTAEDNSMKVYNVTVTRALDPNAPASTNTYLESITITNGSLDKKFNKGNYVYYYKKDGSIKVEAIPEDENSKVVVLEHDDVYTIFVEAPSGDVQSYVLMPEEKNSNLALIISLVASTICIFGGTFAGYRFGKKQKLTLKSQNK